MQYFPCGNSQAKVFVILSFPAGWEDDENAIKVAKQINADMKVPVLIVDAESGTVLALRWEIKGPVLIPAPSFLRPARLLKQPIQTPRFGCQAGSLRRRTLECHMDPTEIVVSKKQCHCRAVIGQLAKGSVKGT